MWRALLLLTLVPPALASQVFEESVSLEEVVRQSPVIVRVEPSGAAARVVVVPFVGPSGPVPDFQAHLDRLRVVEVLRAPPGLLKVGQDVEVGASDVEESLYLHERYYVEGISKSPIYPRYEQGLRPDAAQGRHIRFLRPCTVGTVAAFCLSVGDALVADADRERILALVKAHPWPGAVELPTP